VYRGLLEMATDSGGELTEAVITCEGDMKDPQFPLKFGRLVQRLKSVIFHGTVLQYRLEVVLDLAAIAVVTLICRH